MKHAHHDMHANSKTAYASSDFGERERAILRVLNESACSLTDREVAERLRVHRSEVQPRISDLLTDHVLCEAGDVKCKTTGKTVRTVAIAVPIQMGRA